MKGKGNESKKLLLKVDHILELNKELGTGPLKTIVYEGTYGGTTPRKPSKYQRKRVLVKKIESRLLSDEVDWGLLQGLDHPNVANYIFIRELNHLCSSHLLIAQNFCPYNLEHLAKLLNYNWVTGDVLKSAVRGMAAGLNYLHGQTPDPVVHGNLKPSNVLVKPPLTLPSGFVLTDFWYSSCRQYIPRQCCICCSSVAVEDDPELLHWMAPELVSEGCRPASPSMDVYSFGLILEFLKFQGPLPIDETDCYLYNLLIHETKMVKPIKRISSKDVLHRHPLLMESKQRNTNDIAKMRLKYIKEAYDRMMDHDMSSERRKARQDFESMARSLLGNKILPWCRADDDDDSFNHRMFTTMNKISQKQFDPFSFFDLLRLIRYSKMFLSVSGGDSSTLLKEIQSDSFCSSYPYVLPLVYILVDSGVDAAFLPDSLFEDIKNRAEFVKPSSKIFANLRQSSSSHSPLSSAPSSVTSSRVKISNK